MNKDQRNMTGINTDHSLQTNTSVFSFTIWPLGHWPHLCNRVFLMFRLRRCHTTILWLCRATSIWEIECWKASCVFPKVLLPEAYFVDMGSDVIPEEEDERGELYDDVDHPLPVGSSPPRGQPADDEIYEELPGTYFPVIHLRILGLSNKCPIPSDWQLEKKMVSSSKQGQRKISKLYFAKGVLLDVFQVRGCRLMESE